MYLYLNLQFSKYLNTKLVRLIMWRVFSFYHISIDNKHDIQIWFNIYVKINQMVIVKRVVIFIQRKQTSLYF